MHRVNGALLCFLSIVHGKHTYLQPICYIVCAINSDIKVVTVGVETTSVTWLSIWNHVYVPVVVVVDLE